MRSYLCCLLLLRLVSSLYLENLLIIGSNTPNSLLDELSDFPYRYNISSKSPEYIEEGLKSLDFLFFIDATFETSFYPLLDNLAFQFDTFYFSLSPAKDNLRSSLRFNLHPSYLQQANAMETLIETLNWTKFSLISSTEHSSIKLADYINIGMKKKIDSYSKYSYGMFQNDSDNFIARILKANAVKRLIIIDKGSSLDTIQESIENTKFIVEGSSFILPSEAIYSIKIDGSLILVEKGLENSTSSDNYHHLSILNALSDLRLNLSKFSIIKKDNIFKITKKLYPDHVTCNFYSLVNLKEGNKKIIGEVQDKVNLKGLIYYPKNATTSLEGSIKLVISISNSTTEIYNYYNYTGYLSVTKGALFAVNEINSKNEIPGYEIDLFSTGCGIFLYDPTWYTNCYSKVTDKLGIAYINSIWYIATYGDLVTIKNLGKNLPQISISNTLESLDNRQEFPEFVKLLPGLKSFYSNLNIFYSSLGWLNKCIITDRGQDYLNEFLQVIPAFNINYINSQYTRLFPTNYSRNDFGKYKNYFQEIKDSRCGVIEILTTSKLPYYEALYDIGLRRGDIQVIADRDSVGELNTEDEELYRKKWDEIGGNHINIGTQSWVGDFGQNLEIEMTKYLGKINGGTCFIYDAVGVLKNSIKYIISKGGILEDPNNFMQVVRATKIQGCTGTIRFDSSSNSPINFPVLISQIYLNETSGVYLDMPSALINQYSAILITYLNHLNFPNGIPPAMRPNNLCPFDSYLIRDSTKGMSVFYFLSFNFLLISIVAAYYSFKNSKKIFNESREKKVISVSDFIFISYFVFQYFQIVNYGPDQVFLNYNKLFKFLFLDLIDCLAFSYSKFWNFYEALLVFCTLWNLVCLSVIYFSKFIKSSIINENIFPVVGNICFMPLLSMLIDIYICDKSISNSFTDTYLKFDCTSFCYSGKHLIHAILGTIIIFGFLFLSIFLKLTWEFIQTSLHYNTNSLYMSILSIFQVLVVITSKLFKDNQNFINGGIFCVLLAIFIAITIYVKSYNDDRVRCFQLISLSCSLWEIFITTIFINLDYSFDWVILEISGLGLILIIGITIASKKETIIYFEKNMNISELFHNYVGLFTTSRHEEPA